MIRFVSVLIFVFFSQANASTIKVSIDAAPIWVDWFDMTLTDETGSVSGSFLVQDDGDGIVEKSEVSNVSFSGSGFGGTGRNFDVFQVEDVLNDSVRSIGLGLGLGAISFTNSDGDFMALAWDPYYGFPAFIVAGFFDPTAALLETPEFLVSTENLSNVPAPASFTLMMTALLGFALINRRRRKI